MTTATLIALVVAGLGAGIADGIAGGGGLITVPALLASGLPPHLALGTNKAQSMWGTLAALVTFWRAGRVDARAAVRNFPLAFAGSMLGVTLVLHLAPGALRPVVIALLIVAAVLMLLRKPSRDEDALHPRYLWIAAALSLGIGCYDGFFGPGTGTFLIVGFIVLCGRSISGATADAKVVNFASNVAAAGSFAVAGKVVWSIALPMAVAQLVGGFIGARLAIYRGAILVRTMVLVVSSTLVLKLGYDLLSGW
ncbi:MAG: TSUP family transporter [Myxococcales bacterium]|jgi:uncharacterized protein|nr:TSUP family transporter [Myxococcales bacterium]HRC55758.1 TSUP family transporter [Kofleriaceae bacterium]